MRSSQDIIQLFRAYGVLIEDTHAVYTNGMHATSHMNMRLMQPHTHAYSSLALQLVAWLMGENMIYSAVVSPAVGGVALSQWIAHHASVLYCREILALYCEKDEEGIFRLKGGTDKLVKGRIVLAADDVLSTGGSCRQVVEEVNRCEGSVFVACALVNQGRVTAEDLGVGQLRALVTRPAETYPSWDECPQWLKDRPINTEVGHGAEFLRLHPEIPQPA